MAVADLGTILILFKTATRWYACLATLISMHQDMPLGSRS